MFVGFDYLLFICRYVGIDGGMYSFIDGLYIWMYIYINI